LIGYKRNGWENYKNTTKFVEVIQIYLLFLNTGSNENCFWSVFCLVAMTRIIILKLLSNQRKISFWDFSRDYVCRGLLNLNIIVIVEIYNVIQHTPLKILRICLRIVIVSFIIVYVIVYKCFKFFFTISFTNVHCCCCHWESSMQ
jgi:hypothetical protein